MKTLNLDDFNKNVFNLTEDELNFKGDKPIIIDFYADWCSPCRMISPIMEELSKEYKDKINIYKIDVDSEDGSVIAEKFNIRNIPTVIYANSQIEPTKIVGAMSKKKYVEVIESML